MGIFKRIWSEGFGRPKAARFTVLCPDGADRLRARWEREEDAASDARYFSNRTSCRDWCGRDGDRGCPGGVHTAAPEADPPVEYGEA